MHLFNRSEVTPDETAHLLRRACDRNIPVELHVASGDGEEVLARSRLLGFDDDHVYLDRPDWIEKQVGLDAGREVTVRFFDDETLHSFTANVANPLQRFQLNDSRHVTSVSTSRPRAIDTIQRRGHFRVSLAGGRCIEVAGHESAGPDPVAAPIGASRWMGTLVDLSVGGAGVVVQVPSVAPFQSGSHQFLQFTLPQTEDAMHFHAAVRRAHVVRERASVRLGLEFLVFPDERRFERLGDLLNRFVVDLQRQRLKKSA